MWCPLRSCLCKHAGNHSVTTKACSSPHLTCLGLCGMEVRKLNGAICAMVNCYHILSSSSHISRKCPSSHIHSRTRPYTRPCPPLPFMIVIEKNIDIHCHQATYAVSSVSGTKKSLQAWWNIQHCWLCFVSDIVVEQRRHFIMSIVGTENYNINNILSQSPAIMLAKCPVKITIVPHIMASIRQIKFSGYSSFGKLRYVIRRNSPI